MFRPNFPPQIENYIKFHFFFLILRSYLPESILTACCIVTDHLCRSEIFYNLLVFTAVTLRGYVHVCLFFDTVHIFVSGSFTITSVTTVILNALFSPILGLMYIVLSLCLL